MEPEPTIILLCEFRRGFAATGDVSALGVANSNYVKPEQVRSIDFGYRGKLGKLIVDFNWYYNTYNDFISNETVISPFYGDVGLTKHYLMGLHCRCRYR